MADKPFPAWRRIETILIELLREEGLEIEYFKGDSSTTIILSEDESNTISISDFARQLEERL